MRWAALYAVLRRSRGTPFGVPSALRINPFLLFGVGLTTRRLPYRRTSVSKLDLNLAGPSTAELDAIEVEWPLIAAELDVLDAEIAIINAADRGGPTSLDWRRLRRAEAHVTRVAADLASRPVARKAAA